MSLQITRLSSAFTLDSPEFNSQEGLVGKVFHLLKRLSEMPAIPKDIFAPLLKERMDSTSGMFRPGHKAPTSGIYEVHHAGHGLSHRVTVLYDDVFPHCGICGDKVRFEPVQSALYVNAHPMFNPEV